MKKKMTTQSILHQSKLNETTKFDKIKTENGSDECMSEGKTKQNRERNVNISIIIKEFYKFQTHTQKS